MELRGQVAMRIEPGGGASEADDARVQIAAREEKVVHAALLDEHTLQDASSTLVAREAHIMHMNLGVDLMRLGSRCRQLGVSVALAHGPRRQRRRWGTTLWCRVLFCTLTTVWMA